MTRIGPHVLQPWQEELLCKLIDARRRLGVRTPQGIDLATGPDRCFTLVVRHGRRGLEVVPGSLREVVGEEGSAPGTELKLW